MSLDIEPEFSFKFSNNTRHQCTHPSLESSLLGCCRYEMCKCCVMCCSHRRNVYTLREAEHVQANTVEITLARLEHHNKNGSQDECIVNSLLRPSDSQCPLRLSPTSVSGFLCFRVGFLVVHCARRFLAISTTCFSPPQTSHWHHSRQHHTQLEQPGQPAPHKISFAD